MNSDREKVGTTKLTFLLILLFSFSALNSIIAQNLSFADSVYYHQFDGSDYRASSFNYMGIEGPEGIWYFGNENGLLEFDGSHWKLYNVDNFLPVRTLKYINGRIYITSYNEFGYFERNSSGEMIYTSLRPLLDKDEISQIWFIEEKNGKVYFNNYDGLIIYDGEVVNLFEIEDSHLFKVGEKLFLSVYEKGLAEVIGDSIKYVNTKLKLNNDAAFQILPSFQNRDELLYFTSESGTFKINLDDYSHEKLKSNVSTHFDGKKAYLYNAIPYMDSLYLVSSWEKGFFVTDSKGNFLDTLTADNGLETNYYNSILVDRRDNLWLSNSYGITNIKRVDSLETFDFKPQVYVRYVDINDSLSFSSFNSDSISINKPESSVQFQFAAPSFLKEDLEFRYILEGYDKSWSDWNINTTKEYTNLPGGEYKFKVEARHVYNSSFTFKGAEKFIDVPVLWYKSAWFYVIVVISLGGVIFGFVKYRTARLTSINRTLEQTVKANTKDLLREQKKLQDAYEELKIINHELDNFVYRSSHDLVAPLKSLRGLIQITQLAESDQQRQEYFSLMNVSINKLEEFIKNIMEFSTNTKKPLQFETFQLDEVTDSIVDDLKFYENADRVELIRDYDHNFEIETDKKRLNIVLSNLITNAVKYHNYQEDHKPYIKLSAAVENGEYRLSVKDNGKGIPDEYQDKIFDMFFRANQSTEGSGLGLYIVVDTLKVLGGRIEIESKLRQGSTFTVILPFPENLKGKTPAMQHAETSH